MPRTSAAGGHREPKGRRASSRASTARAITKKRAGGVAKKQGRDSKADDEHTRSRRTPTLTKSQRDQFATLILSHRNATAKQLAALAKRKLDISITPAVAEKEAKRLDRDAGAKKRRSGLTAEDMAQRLRWCRKYRKWTWEHAVFLDVVTVNYASRFISVGPGEPIPEEWLEVDEPDVFALVGISRKGKCGIAFFEGRLTADRYVEMLEDDILPVVRKRFGRQSWYFVQNHSRTQTAPVVLELAEREKVRFVQLPSRSPDLNPVKSLWSRFRDHISPCSPPKTKIKEVEKLWARLDKRTINHDIDTVQSNVKLIIQAEGGRTK